MQQQQKKTTTGAKKTTTGAKKATTTGAKKPVAKTTGTKQVAGSQPVQQQQQQQNHDIKILEEINLTAMMQKVEYQRDVSKKSTVLIEFAEAAPMFFKYKGAVIDITEMVLKEGLEQQTRAESVEQARKQMVHAMRIGDNLAIVCEFEVKNLNEFFKDQPFWTPQLFDIEGVRKDDFKPLLLKDGEDKDIQGNVGFFRPEPKFNLNILVTKAIVEKTAEEHVKQVQAFTCVDERNVDAYIIRQ